MLQHSEVISSEQHVMPNPDGSDLYAVIASEVAKQLPVDAALKAPASQTGALLEDAVKCVRLIAFPLQVGAVLQDRFRRFIERSADRVPDVADRIVPQPQILGPVLEAIRFVPEGSMSDEAFSQLLSRAFDRERVGQAHPAFPAIIRALTDDEVALFRRVVAGPIFLRYATRLQDVQTPLPDDADRPEFSYLVFPQQVEAYATHLEALGLIHDLVGQSPENTDFTQPGPYDLGFMLHVSAFGKLFANAVLDLKPPSGAHG